MPTNHWAIANEPAHMVPRWQYLFQISSPEHRHCLCHPIKAVPSWTTRGQIHNCLSSSKTWVRRRRLGWQDLSGAINLWRVWRADFAIYHIWLPSGPWIALIAEVRCGTAQNNNFQCGVFGLMPLKEGMLLPQNSFEKGKMISKEIILILEEN